MRTLALLAVFAPTAIAADPADAAKALRAKGWTVGTEGSDVTLLAAPGGKDKGATAEDVALIELFPKLKVLRLSGPGVADEALEVLTKLPTLRELRLNAPAVTDAAAKHFAALTGLTDLGLNVGFTPAGYAQLPVFEQVAKLNLGGDGFTAPVVALVPAKFPNAVRLDFNHPNKLKDADLAPLAELKKAEGIILSGSVSLGDGLADTLARMPALKRIEVGHVFKFTDAGLEKLKGLPNLEMLQLGSKGVTDAGLAHLAEIKTLREIVLGDPSPVTAKGIEHLVKLPNLTRLALQAPTLADDAMPFVATIKSLEEVDVVSNGFTDAALPPLKELPKLRKLKLGEFYRQPQVTDAGLKSLGGLKAVEQIVISPLCQGVTDSGVSDLKAALPRVKISR